MKTKFFKNQAKLKATSSNNKRYTNQSSTLYGFARKQVEVIR